MKLMYFVFVERKMSNKYYKRVRSSYGKFIVNYDFWNDGGSLTYKSIVVHLVRRTFPLNIHRE